MARSRTMQENHPLDEYSPNEYFCEAQDVGSGAWVMVVRTIPVERRYAPKVYGIYWALPHEEGGHCRDRFGRQAVKVYTPVEVVLLNHEYSVVSDERFEMYRKGIGYELHETGANIEMAMNLEYLEKGRSLCEEEREVIWALQVDGLTEYQACEEYFLSHHTDTSNVGIYYLPPKEVVDELIVAFGDR